MHHAWRRHAAPSATRSVADDARSDIKAQVAADAAGEPVRLVLVRSATPNCFIAGADIGELLALPDAAAATALNVRVHALFDRISALPVPTVAVIDGACLGGGTELPLACSYCISRPAISAQALEERFAMSRSKAVCCSTPPTRTISSAGNASARNRAPV